MNHNICCRKISKLAGILCTLVSCILYMVNNFLVKYSCNVMHYYVIDVLLIRGLSNIVFTIIGMRVENQSRFQLVESDFHFIKIRLLLIIPTSFLFSIGVLYISVSLATVVYYTTPLVTILMASYSLNEKTHIYDIIAAFFSFLGLIVVTKPPFLFGSQENYTMSFYLAILGFLVCSVSNAYANIMCRKIKSKINFMVLTYYYGITFTMVNSVVLFVLPRSKEYIVDFGYKDVLFCIFIAAVQFIGSYFQYISFKYDEAGRVTIFTYCQVLFTYIVEITLFHIVPDFITIIGAILIVGSCITVVFNKLVEARRKRTLSKDSATDMEKRLSIE